MDKARFRRPETPKGRKRKDAANVRCPEVTFKRRNFGFYLWFLPAKTGYPRYPQNRNPPKVDEKTKENRAFSKSTHRLSTKLSTIGESYPPFCEVRIFAKKAQKYTHYSISQFRQKWNVFTAYL